jgi:glycosyltransferase 2 family protein
MQRAIEKFDFSWSFLVFAVTFWNHYLRARRWVNLLSKLEQPIHVFNAWRSLMSGYFVNLFVPRLGEITRSSLLSTRNNLNFAFVFGTVITERIIDILCLLLICAGVVFFQSDRLSGFITHNIYAPFHEKVFILLHVQRFSILNLGFVVLLFLSLMGLIYLFFKRAQYGIAQLVSLFKKVIEGVSSIFYLKKPRAFILDTLGIWVGYFLMTYLWVVGIKEIDHFVALEISFSLLVMGSLGRLVPIQGGGVGVYHWIAVGTLALYSIDTTTAMLLAVIIHGFQTLFYLIVGGICFLDNFKRFSD